MGGHHLDIEAEYKKDWAKVNGLMDKLEQALTDLASTSYYYHDTRRPGGNHNTQAAQTRSKCNCHKVGCHLDHEEQDRNAAQICKGCDTPAKEHFCYGSGDLFEAANSEEKDGYESFYNANKDKIK